MRQVPASYLILGDGRVARHIRRYFELEGLRFSVWSRSSGEPLFPLIKSTSHILFAISDRAISPLYESEQSLSEKICVHFSGALSHPFIHGAHPLMTFAESLYSLEKYRSIPFVTEKNRPKFPELFPQLKNLSYEIAGDQKPLYHALCALSGNFTTLLWEKTFSEFGAKFDLPKEVLVPYLRQIAENLETSAPAQSVLTGPLARGDQAVVEKHLHALGSDPYAQVYKSFVEAYRQENPK